MKPILKSPTALSKVSATPAKPGERPGATSAEAAAPPATTGYAARPDGAPPEPVLRELVIEEPVPYQPVGYESIGRSALRHPLLVGVVTAAGLMLGAAVAFAHAPTYSAEAQLIVGRVSNLSADQVPGYAAGVESLASDYARLITSGEVVSAAEHTLGTTALPGSLSATPVPNSAVIDVIGSASSKSEAVRIANAGASALTSVVAADTNDTQAQVAPLMADYTKAEQAYQAATAKANLLSHNLTVLFAKIGNKNPTPFQAAQESALNAEIADEQTLASQYQLQATTYYNQYQSAVPPLAAQEELVQQTGPAAYTGSDRKSFLEAAGLVGLVGGFAVGLAGAAFLDSRAARKRPKAAAA